MPLQCETICQVAAWKNNELQRYCHDFVKAGLDLLADGVPYFGSDDVPEENQPMSHAVPGSAISMLRKAHVIEDFFGSIKEENIIAGRRTSRRRLAHGRQVKLFQLTSKNLAESYLERLTN